jgi:ADP-ribose pyrophosphatase YjhB (NUDIX family)
MIYFRKGLFMSLNKKLRKIQIEEDRRHLLAKIGQYALIGNSKNKILVLKRIGEGNWSLPGGRLNKREDWKQSFIREIKEETNLDCQNPQPFEVNVLPDPYQVKYCVYFSVDVSDLDKLKISKEHTKYKWIDCDGAQKIKFDDEKVRKVIKNYKDFTNGRI